MYKNFAIIILLLGACFAGAQPRRATQKVFVAQDRPDHAPQAPEAPEAPDDQNTIDPIDESAAPDPAPPSPTAAAPELKRHNDLPAEEEKASSAAGEKIFDWSKYKNSSEVPHPFAEKGLIRIDKDRNYYYRVGETVTNRAVAVHMGAFAPSQLANPDANGQRGATFRENYDQTSNPAVLFMYEWQLYRSAIGKFGLQAGSGLFFAQGHGHFAGTTNAALTPREGFSFVAFPNSFGAIYRMQFWDRQLFTPYAGGGGIAMAFSEFRDDNKGPKFGGALVAYVDAGLAVNMTYFDYLARVQLNREYGIHAVYLILEYRQLLALTQRYNFTTPYANAGFLVEY